MAIAGLKSRVLLRYVDVAGGWFDDVVLSVCLSAICESKACRRIFTIALKSR